MARCALPWLHITAAAARRCPPHTRDAPQASTPHLARHNVWDAVQRAAEPLAQAAPPRGRHAVVDGHQQGACLGALAVLQHLMRGGWVGGDGKGGRAVRPRDPGDPAAAARTPCSPPLPTHTRPPRGSLVPPRPAPCTVGPPPRPPPPRPPPALRQCQMSRPAAPRGTRQGPEGGEGGGGGGEICMSQTGGAPACRRHCRRRRALHPPAPAAPAYPAGTPAGSSGSRLARAPPPPAPPRLPAWPPARAAGRRWPGSRRPRPAGSTPCARPRTTPGEERRAEEVAARWGGGAAAAWKAAAAASSQRLPEAHPPLLPLRPGVAG